MLKSIFEKWKYSKEYKIDKVDFDVKAIILTDNGNVRQNNEDAARFVRPTNVNLRKEKGFLAILADGMGGHASGEVASNLAVDHISKLYYRTKDTGLLYLAKLFNEANSLIYHASLKNQMHNGMGTTCSAVLIEKEEISIVHIGDSRIYILSEENLYQVSEDHTYVLELLKANLISPKEVLNHPDKNILSRAMGTKSQIEIQSKKLSFKTKSVSKIFVCSDGLYEYISDLELGKILTGPNIGDMATYLMNLAKQRGGHDNITFIILDFIPMENDEKLRETKAYNF
jgi:PPM family protein phosphatase